MESVFDHNPTQEEIRYIGLDCEGFKKFGVPQSQDSHYGFIASLYHFRKNKKKMDEYINKIKDPEARFAEEYSHYHYSNNLHRI